MNEKTLAKEIANELGKRISWFVSFSALFIVVFVWLANKNDWGIDETDLDGRNRSGMVIRTDYKTGVQYLESSLGGLTPRLDENGKQMRVEVKR